MESSEEGEDGHFRLDSPSGLLLLNGMPISNGDENIAIEVVATGPAEVHEALGEHMDSHEQEWYQHMCGGELQQLDNASEERSPRRKRSTKQRRVSWDTLTAEEQLTEFHEEQDERIDQLVS